MSPEQKLSSMNTKLSRRSLLKKGGILIDVVGFGAGIPITVYSGNKAQKIDRQIDKDIAQLLPDAPDNAEVVQARETLQKTRNTIVKKDLVNDPNVVSEIQDILYSDEVTHAHIVLDRDKERDTMQQEMERTRGSITWNMRTFYGLLSVGVAAAHRIRAVK